MYNKVMLIVDLGSKVGNISQFLWLGESFHPSTMRVEPFRDNFQGALFTFSSLASSTYKED
jgi:hypothetical protein